MGVSVSGKNPLGNGKEPQSYEGLNVIVPVGGWRVIVSSRSPTSNDTKYPLASIWCNKTNNTVWILTSFNPTNWTEFAASVAGAIIQITGGAGVPILPSAGNVNILGTANQIQTTGAAATLTLSLIGPYTPATYTAHGVLIGEGTGPIVATAAGTNGQVLTGATGADPAFSALGTNSGLTAHGVLLGEGNSAIAAAAVGTNGQVLLGSSAADPAFGTLTTSTGIAFTTGAAALAIDVQNGGLAVVDQSSGSVTMAKQTTYITDDGATQVVYTLPLAVNAALGNIFQITGSSAGSWILKQNALQTIHVGGQTSTTGTGGSIAPNNRYNSITLQCVNAGLDFVCVAQSGNFTVV